MTYAAPDEWEQVARAVEWLAPRIEADGQATDFGVANQDDSVTQSTARQLVIPLATKLQAENADWSVQTIPPAQATKATLASLLGGDQTPSLLFTTSHGMNFARDSIRQIPHQGALLCQDWPGPQLWTQAIPEDFYLPATAWPLTPICWA